MEENEVGIYNAKCGISFYEGFPLELPGGMTNKEYVLELLQRTGLRPSDLNKIFEKPYSEWTKLEGAKTSSIMEFLMFEKMCAEDGLPKFFSRMSDEERSKILAEKEQLNNDNETN